LKKVALTKIYATISDSFVYLQDEFSKGFGRIKNVFQPLMIGRHKSNLLVSDTKVGYAKEPTDLIELANKGYVDKHLSDYIIPENVSSNNDLLIQTLGTGDMTLKTDKFYLKGDSGDFFFNVDADASILFMGDNTSDVAISLLGQTDGVMFSMGKNLSGLTEFKMYELSNAEDYFAISMPANAVYFQTPDESIEWQLGEGDHRIKTLDGTEFMMYYNNTSNYFKIGTVADGATTFSTSDGDSSTNGHLTLDIDGDITLDSASGNFIAKKAGTEFSSANSAYAGMILGYTCLRGDGTNLSTFEIQNSLTVEDATHKVSFKTPPSENVEIEAIFLVNASSTDTRIAVGLSDSSTYNAVSQIHEYDGNAVWFTDDEIDDSLITVKFVLTSTELASIGSDNTFWIGISTDGFTKTAYLTYGLRSAFGIGEHPFIIKATALPATIYDGS
jgi:hypothetical protein